MVTSPKDPKLVLPAHGDPIRVVPLHSAEEIAAAAPAQLTYRHGPLLTAVEVFTVFWGSAWQQPPQSDLMQNVNQFFDFILTSPLLDQLTEYSMNGDTISHGKHIGTTTITVPNLHH